MSEEIKQILKVLIPMGILLFIVFVYPFHLDMDGCNRWFNTTGDHPTMDGNCYVPGSSISYQSTRTCTGGFLGIGEACTESIEPKTKYYRTTVCINAKTGERCE